MSETKGNAKESVIEYDGKRYKLTHYPITRAAVKRASQESAYAWERAHPEDSQMRMDIVAFESSLVEQLVKYWDIPYPPPNLGGWEKIGVEDLDLAEQLAEVIGIPLAQKMLRGEVTRAREAAKNSSSPAGESIPASVPSTQSGG